MIKTFYRIFLTAFFLCLGGVTYAQQSNDPVVVDPETVIEIDPNKAADDLAIAERITGIFAELDGLEDVTVSVSEGVVTLGGETASDAAAQKALRLAVRLNGVVTIEDKIKRSLDVESNVTPLLNEYRQKIQRLIEALPLLGVALMVFIFFCVVGRVLSKRRRFWRRVTPSPFLAEILAQALMVIMCVIGMVLALDLIGASALLTTILGGAGVLGIAIGFAIRDTMENYISSIMLSIRQPFRAKDHVIINDKEGIVVRLTSRATVLMTLEGNHLRIPNSEVFKGTILNYTTNPERRFSFQLGIDAADDPVDAIRVGLEAMREHEFVLEEPTSSAIILDVGDSNIVIKFFGWVDQRETNYGKARSLAIRSVKTVLEDKGFTLPEPIYRVRFDPTISQAVEQTVGKSGSSTTPVRSKTRKPSETSSIDDEFLDVKPDQDLVQKVEEEIKEAEANDLLDHNQPKE